MHILLHKFIIIIIIIFFIVGLFLVREHVNNSILPEREKKLTEKINKEIITIKDNYKNKLYIDSQQSSSYIINNFKDKLDLNVIEELKLIKANSIAKIAIKSENTTNIENSIEYFKPLIKSQIINIKVKALLSIAETTMSYPTPDIHNINSSILYLDEAFEIAKEENIINNYLSYFYSMTLIEKYIIEKNSKIKHKAIKLLNDNIVLNNKLENIDSEAESKINLAMLYTKISKTEQARRNLKKAFLIIEEVKDIITRQYNPRKNAEIMRILGDLYYLRAKLPQLDNEAGTRYIQDIVKYKTKSKNAYNKAEQMGFFQDIVPGVKELKRKDAENRNKKEINIVDDSNGGGPMRSDEDKEKK